MKSQKLSISKAIFLQCDIQEKFIPRIYRINSVIHTAKILNKAANLFQIPLVVSEQVPKSLGVTPNDIKATYPKNQTFYFEKTRYSMWPQIFPFAEITDRYAFVLYGIEGHVCVLQTALDLREKGYNVYIPVEGVSSSRPLDRSIGLRRMEREGCKLNSYEGIMMELLGDINHKDFKPFLELMKEKRPDDLIDHL